jgi:hypothetical protein
MVWFKCRDSRATALAIYGLIRLGCLLSVVISFCKCVAHLKQQMDPSLWLVLALLSLEWLPFAVAVSIKSLSHYSVKSAARENAYTVFCCINETPLVIGLLGGEVGCMLGGSIAV